MYRPLVVAIAPRTRLGLTILPRRARGLGGKASVVEKGYDMTTLFSAYKREACTIADGRTTDARAAWVKVADWWPNGRRLFVEVFQKEVGMRPSRAPIDHLLAAALPKSEGDLRRKETDGAYYAAHAALFLAEMNDVVSRVPRVAPDRDVAAFANALRFVDDILAESVVLLEHWAERSLGVPGAFGIGKVEFEHTETFYRGARQIIYGQGGFLSFPDNHADLAVGIIRQAVEIRVRRAFGVIGRFSEGSSTIDPIPMGKLFDAIQPFEPNISSEVPFSVLRRVNGWANLYLHAGLKLPSWTAPRVLGRLKPLLLGTGRQPGDGIKMSRSTLDAVRLELAGESGISSLSLFPVDYCEAVISPFSETLTSTLT